MNRAGVGKLMPQKASSGWRGLGKKRQMFHSQGYSELGSEPGEEEVKNVEEGKGETTGPAGQLFSSLLQND